MRIWHRLKTFVPLIVACSMATVAQAQTTMGIPSYGAPAFLANGSGGAYGQYPGGPQAFQSHPMISPFDNAFEQHFSSDGIWFKKVLSSMAARNDYYFNVDWVRTKTRGITGEFANGDAATFGMIQGELDTLTLNNFSTLNVAGIPELRTNGLKLSGGVRSPLGWSFGWDATWNSPGQARYDAREGYEATRLQHIDAINLELTNGELLPQTGFSNFDEQQFAIDNILTTGDIDTALTSTFQILGDADEVLDRVLMNLHSIPLLNGVVDEPGGVAQRFDLEFIARHEIESYDTGLHFTWSPVYESDRVKVSPLFGARYVRTDELFSFFGMDSGLEYDANIPDGIDDDDDFIVDNVAETGDSTFTASNPSLESLSISYLDSYVQSKMAGPEAGISYVIGAKNGVRILGSTRVGAYWNSERIVLNGDNIGDTLSFITNPNPDPNDPNAPADILEDMFDTSSLNNGVPTQNAFNDGKSSTHISPVLRQELTAEIPLFSKVPVLRDCWQLEHARLRAGWTYMWIGEVADPQQSIVLVSNPRQFNLRPHLNVKRSSFFQNQFNLGINWEF